mmetsp:Transcript_57621/g.153441  ORF Transcript_57621/g.153441 Transcript_57621/m.153441 type:complete len:323 (-) Transcript_57621:1220-2188(-)
MESGRIGLSQDRDTRHTGRALEKSMGQRILVHAHGTHTCSHECSTRRHLSGLGVHTRAAKALPERSEVIHRGCGTSECLVVLGANLPARQLAILRTRQVSCLHAESIGLEGRKTLGAAKENATVGTEKLVGGAREEVATNHAHIDLRVGDEMYRVHERDARWSDGCGTGAGSSDVVRRAHRVRCGANGHQPRLGVDGCGCDVEPGIQGAAVLAVVPCEWEPPHLDARGTCRVDPRRDIRLMGQRIQHHVLSSNPRSAVATTTGDVTGKVEGQGGGIVTKHNLLRRAPQQVRRCLTRSSHHSPSLLRRRVRAAHVRSTSNELL